jgi:peptidoglycan hydrolase-like protein with peptidoglycan-binding domain
MLLKVGSRGKEVKELQEFLEIGADGIFGKGTESSVKKWQSENGLVAEPYLATAGCWYVCRIPDEVQQVTLDIDGYGQKILETLWDVVKYNGLLKIN